MPNISKNLSSIMNKPVNDTESTITNMSGDTYGSGSLETGSLNSAGSKVLVRRRRRRKKQPPLKIAL